MCLRSLWVLSLVSVVCPQDSPTLSPCNFPLPSQGNFMRRCGKAMESNKYLCDIHQSLSYTGMQQINNVIYGSENGSFYNRITNSVRKKDEWFKVEVGIAILRTIVLPDVENLLVRRTLLDAQRTIHTRTRHTKLLPLAKKLVNRRLSYKSRDFVCVVNSSWPISLHGWEARDNKRYIQLFAYLLRKRWFGKDTCDPHVFILASKDGAVSLNDSTRVFQAPVMEISFGGRLLNLLGEEGALQLNTYAQESVLKGWPLPTVIANVLRTISQAVTKMESRDKKTIYSIPMWAVQMWFASLGLAFLLVVLDWLIVRNKGFSLKSLGGRSGGGGGGGASAGATSGGRTHLMF